MSELLIVALFSLVGGIVGGFLAKNTETLLKDLSLKQRMKNLEADLESFTDRQNIKYNGLARTVKNVLGDLEEIGGEYASQTSKILEGIPDEIIGFAEGLGVDLAKALTGDAAELKKITELAGKKGGPVQNVEGGI